MGTELSLCMIVKNEEGRLAQCLESVRDAVDEIVILDTGSTDGTREIARRYTDRVYDYGWEDDFSKARNASFSLATKPYILWLDADDVIDPPEIKKLITLKENLEGVDAVMMPYHYAFSSDGTPSLVFERERIVRREAGFAFCGAVHEAMVVGGNVIHADISVRHTGQHGEPSNRRNLRIYELQIARGKAMSARDRYYYARELKSAGEYKRAERAFAAFLDQADGWPPNRADAMIARGECLMKMGRRKEAKESYLAAAVCGLPRAEAFCALGACCMEEGELEAAALWYRAAMLCPIQKESGAFVAPDAYGYVPLMQLCVIYDRMGDHKKASLMNEQALALRPGDAAATANRAYFARVLPEKKAEETMEIDGQGA